MDYCFFFVLCSERQACSTELLLPAINISTLNIFQNQKGFFFLCSSMTLNNKKCLPSSPCECMPYKHTKAKKRLHRSLAFISNKGCLSFSSDTFPSLSSKLQEEMTHLFNVLRAVASLLKHYLSCRTMRSQIHSVIWISLISLTPAIWTVSTGQNCTQLVLAVTIFTGSWDPCCMCHAEYQPEASSTSAFSPQFLTAPDSLIPHHLRWNSPKP